MKRILSALFLLLTFPVIAQTVEYIHTDALGSPVAITNEAAQVIERTDYEPYGSMIGKANNDRPGYTGHVMDSATGLTYMQQRYYDPVIGRFLSVDPVTTDAKTGGNFNRYWYANNNPYGSTDPDGRCPDKNPCAEPTPPNLFRDSFVGRLLGAALGDPIALARSDSYNPLLNEYRSTGELQDAKMGILLMAAPAGRIGAEVGNASRASTVSVGRWMSDTEMNAMMRTGRVQESTLNGVTSVSSPPNPSAWVRQTTAPNYVRFDVKASAVRPAGSTNAKIYGPNSIFGSKLQITEMPKATNITQIACRVPMKC